MTSRPMIGRPETE